VWGGGISPLSDDHIWYYNFTQINNKYEISARCVFITAHAGTLIKGSTTGRVVTVYDASFKAMLLSHSLLKREPYQNVYIF
jgi:hypothetical protein